MVEVRAVSRRIAICLKDSKDVDEVENLLEKLGFRKVREGDYFYEPTVYKKRGITVEIHYG